MGDALKRISLISKGIGLGSLTVTVSTGLPILRRKTAHSWINMGYR